MGHQQRHAGRYRRKPPGRGPDQAAQCRFRGVVADPGVGDEPSRVEAIDGEKAGAVPMRKRGKVVVFDAASFNQVLKDNGDAGDIAIYFDRNPDKPSVVAVLNGNGAKGAGWSDFRAEIQFRPTPQWVKWKAIDGKMLPQATFAEFIEDNIEDIADPAGSTMLEIASYLEATRSVSFKSGVRLSSGAIQFQNVEDIDAKVGSGRVEIPETFTLGVAPIFGLPPYRIPARFRYRIQDGKLQLGLKLQRIEDMMSTIIEDVIAKIERGANISVLDGLPPALSAGDVMKPRHPRQREHALQTQIVKWVRECVVTPHDLRAFDRSRDFSGKQHLFEKNRGIKAGTPDTVLLYNGTSFWAELKVKGNEPSFQQEGAIASIVRTGNAAEVIYSVQEYHRALVTLGLELRPLAALRAEHFDRLLASADAKAADPSAPSKSRAHSVGGYRVHKPSRRALASSAMSQDPNRPVRLI